MGVPSCFSGGRRMVKCTSSTLASDFSRLRQVRSPAWGSPETSRTFNLSRTPSMVTTALLFSAVSSSGRGAMSSSTTLGPPCSIITGARTICPGMARILAITTPSRRTVIATRSPLSDVSSTRTAMVCSLPTIPKRGASMSSMRRSRSPAWPVTKTCRGALKPRLAAEAGMSCTTPSVTRMAAPTRSGGTSASAALSDENSRVPSLPVSVAPPSMKRVSTSPRPSSAFSMSTRALSVCALRSPMLWLALRSSTTATTSLRGLRSSRTSEGSVSAASTSARPTALSHAPRRRAHRPRPTTIKAPSASAISRGIGMRGAIWRLKEVNGPAAPGGHAHAPDRPCSCR